MMTDSSDDVDNDVDVNNVILTISINGDKCQSVYVIIDDTKMMQT